MVVRQRLPGGSERVELIERPTEGALFETFSLLAEREGGTLWVARGAGEGDLESGAATGYSGLAAALVSEGYQLHPFVGAATRAIPDDAAAVLWIAPERALPAEALAALDAYLARGPLVALLEPVNAGGLEEVLSRWASSPPAASWWTGLGDARSCVEGLCPLVFATPPVTRSPAGSTTRA